MCSGYSVVILVKTQNIYQFLPYSTRGYPLVLHNTKISLCESVNKLAVIEDNCIWNITRIIILGMLDKTE